MNAMKIIFLLALSCSSLLAAPDFSIMGFATTDGGTTGGKGGSVVTPSSLAELKQYAENKTTPYIIRITKEFNTGVSVKIDGDGAVTSSGTSTTYGDVIRLGSNKTLVGIGNSAFLNRIGIIIQCQSNIIIRNIKFTMKDVPISKTNENKIVSWANGAEKILSDPDCIGIQADDALVAEAERITKHIWIDHCEFYNQDPAVMTNVDRYDGLVDGKNNSSNITISWCYFHDHHKASLMGKGDSDNFDRKITYSHNYFKNIVSRLPLIRFGKCHLLNNYMITSENGANARINSDLYIEANHFQDSKKPVFGKISENGAATFVNNKWVSCDRIPQIILSAGGATGDPLSASEELLKGTFKPSTFYSYKADAAGDLPSIVLSNSGVGKINTDEYNVTSVKVVAALHDKTALSAKVSGQSIVVRAETGTPVYLYNVLGAIVYSAKIPVHGNTISFNAPNGAYIIKSGSIAETIIVH